MSLVNVLSSQALPQSDVTRKWSLHFNALNVFTPQTNRLINKILPIGGFLSLVWMFDSLRQAAGKKEV